MTPASRFRLYLLQLVEQFQQLRELFLAEPLLDALVVLLHVAAHGDEALLALFRQVHVDPPLVLGRLPAPDDAVALQARQHAGHARAQDAGLVGQLVALHLALLAQDADHPPLLLGETVLVEGGAEETHRGFASLQQGQGQGGSWR